MVMGLTRQVCFAMVQAAETAGAVYQGVEVEVLRSSGWVMMDGLLVSRTPEALWRSGPAWLPQDR